MSPLDRGGLGNAPRLLAGHADGGSISTAWRPDIIIWASTCTLIASVSSGCNRSARDQPAMELS